MTYSILNSNASRFMVVSIAIALLLISSMVLLQETSAASPQKVPKAYASITVTKMISTDNATWEDANTPPGLNVTEGTPLYFRFDINNTCNVTLTCITLKDSCYRLTNLTLPQTLEPNTTFTYYFGPVSAKPSQHTDTATVTAKYGRSVCSDTDKATYYGMPLPHPSICITKYVSTDCRKWYDANTPPGLMVLAGQNVTFKLVIKNTGNVPLDIISIVDIYLPIFPLIDDTLAPRETMTLTLGPIEAIPLQSINLVAISASYENQTVSSIDLAFVYGSLCTYTARDYSASGAAKLLLTNFNSTFPEGLTIGNYNSSNGYGYNWTNPIILKQFLKSYGASGPITADALNPCNTSLGGGALAVQAATLTLNIAFGEQSIKCMPSGLESLVFICENDTLNGLTVAQILAVANGVLANRTLPDGYTYDSLACLIANINGAFKGCQPNSWARTHLEVAIL